MLTVQIPKAANIVQAKIATSASRSKRRFEVEHAIAKNVLDGMLEFRVWHEVADGVVVFRAHSLQAILLGVDLDISIAVPITKIRNDLACTAGELIITVANAALFLRRTSSNSVSVRIQVVNQLQLVSSLRSVALRAPSYNARKTIETVIASIMNGESVVLETRILLTDLIGAQVA